MGVHQTGGGSCFFGGRQKRLPRGLLGVVTSSVPQPAHSSLSPAAWLARYPLDLWAVETEAVALLPVQTQDPLCTVVRGLLGERLRALRCLTRAPTCEGCEEAFQCDFARFFDAGSLGASGGVPPFWLQGVSARSSLDAGERLVIRVVLQGTETAMLPYVEAALRDAVLALGRPRSGPSKPLFTLRARPPRRLVPEAIARTRWTIEALSPLILQDDPVPPRELCPEAPLMAQIARAGVRRLQRLARASRGDVPWVELPDLRGIRVCFGQMIPWTGSHFSQRQQKRYPLGGLVGSFEVEGDALSALSPLLAALPLVGVGKKTTHGFGHLRVSAAE